jgi:hypothetical protein
MQEIHALVQKGQAALEHSSSQAESAGQHQFEVVEQFKKLRVTSSKATPHCNDPAGYSGTVIAPGSTADCIDDNEPLARGDDFSSSSRRQPWPDTSAEQLECGCRPQQCSDWDCSGSYPVQHQQIGQQQCSRHRLSHNHFNYYDGQQQRNPVASAEYLPERWQTAARPARQPAAADSQWTPGATAYASPCDIHTLQRLAAENNQYAQQKNMMAARESWQTPAEAAAECACCSEQDAGAAARRSMWRLSSAPEHGYAVPERQHWQTAQQPQPSVVQLPVSAVHRASAAAAAAAEAWAATPVTSSLQAGRLSSNRPLSHVAQQQTPQKQSPPEQQQQQRKVSGAGLHAGADADDVAPADKGLRHAEQQQQALPTWSSWREHAAQLLGASQGPDSSSSTKQPVASSQSQLLRRRPASAGQQRKPAEKEC